MDKPLGLDLNMITVRAVLDETERSGTALFEFFTQNSAADLFYSVFVFVNGTILIGGALGKCEHIDKLVATYLGHVTQRGFGRRGGAEEEEKQVEEGDFKAFRDAKKLIRLNGSANSAEDKCEGIIVFDLILVQLGFGLVFVFFK